MKRRRSFKSPRLVAAAIATAATLVSVAGLEFYLRLVETHVTLADAAPAGAFLEHNPGWLVRHTPNGRRLVPNARVVIRNHYLSGRDIPVRTNSLGFRGPEYTPEPPPNTVRILVLGDSVTWGDFLHEEETYVHRLESRLNESSGDERFEVINAAIGDFGTREEIDLLVERGLGIHPDEVVLAFYLNDSRPPWGFPGELGSRGWLRRHSLLAESVYRNLKLFGWMQERGTSRVNWIPKLDQLDWKNDPNAFRELAFAARFDWGAAWQPDSWESVAEEFRRLQRLSTEDDFGVTVAVFPVSYQVFATFLDDLPQRRACELARDLGFRCLDLLPLLRENRDRPLFYDQCHPAPEASRLIGEALAEFLSRKRT